MTASHPAPVAVAEDAGQTRDPPEEPFPTDPTTEQQSLWDHARWKKDLVELLRQGFGSLERGQSTTPVEIGDMIVLPVLRHLDWDVRDGERVARGHRTATGAVDFALCGQPGSPQVLIKVGATPGPADEASRHPFEDRTIHAIQLAVSNDGHVWRFHLAPGRGTIRSREFERVQVDAEADVAEPLERYLGFHAVESGDALRNAERDYGRRRFSAEAQGAWRRSLLGPELPQRFLLEMEEAMGVAPDPGQAEEFVFRQRSSMSWPPDPPEPTPARRVGIGDQVWVYDPISREIVTHTVVDGDPDADRNEVSRDSGWGVALLDALEGQERELRLPKREPRSIRIVLIGRLAVCAAERSTSRRAVGR